MSAQQQVYLFLHHPKAASLLFHMHLPVLSRRAFHESSIKTLALISSPSFGKTTDGSSFRHGFSRLGISSPHHDPLSLDALKGVARIHTSSLNTQQSMAVQREDEDGHSQTAPERPQQHEEVVTGSIHLIVGPMFAGKTTTLLKRVQAEALAGRNVAMVKSNKDTRYALSSVVSHDGLQMPCWAVPNLARFRDKIGEKSYAKLDVIGIDEAQFLQDLCSFCQVAADHEGKTLIVAGLDGDFLRNRFGSILELVPLADSVVKLSSRCEMCGKPAFFTFRKTNESKKEVIGGVDVYMPVCRQHYYSGKIAMETARTVLEAQKFLALQCENVGTVEQ